MKATLPAQRLWATVSKEARLKILNKVWCGNCATSGGIVIKSMRATRGDLLLEGNCTKCDGPVARVIETSGR